MRRIFGILALTIATSTCGETPPSPPPAPCTAEGGLPAECGAIRAFENRTTRRGRQIDVKYVVLRATPGPATGAVFLLAGGPGTASTALAPWAAGWMQPLRASLDMVFVDQRGTGGSHPLKCESDLEPDPALAFGHIFRPDSVRRCRATLEKNADLTQYSTAYATEDIDDVRAKLGYEKVSIYGGSYGTRLALAYAHRFPERVRSMVLDGVMPPDVRVPLTYAASAGDALNRVIAFCRARPQCDGWHPNLAGDVSRLFARFDAGPVHAAVRPGATPFVVPMTRGDYGYAVRGMMYDAAASRDLPALLARAASSGSLDVFAQAYWDRAARLQRTLTRGLHLSVLCSEDVALIRDDEIDAATAGTFLGRYIVDEYRGACAEWPQAAADPRPTAFTAVRAPTLLVSGLFDPVTPPSMADRVAASLPLARHIVAPTGSHGSAAGCPRAAALHVLIRATLDDLPGGCEK